MTANCTAAEINRAQHSIGAPTATALSSLCDPVHCEDREYMMSLVTKMQAAMDASEGMVSRSKKANGFFNSIRKTATVQIEKINALYAE